MQLRARIGNHVKARCLTVTVCATAPVRKLRAHRPSTEACMEKADRVLPPLGKADKEEVMTHAPRCLVEKAGVDGKGRGAGYAQHHLDLAPFQPFDGEAGAQRNGMIFAVPWPAVG